MTLREKALEYLALIKEKAMMLEVFGRDSLEPRIIEKQVRDLRQEISNDYRKEKGRVE